MNRNVGGLDRIARILVGGALLAVGTLHPRFRGRRGGRDGIVRGLVVYAGADLLATALVRFCPVNSLLGIDTCEGSARDAIENLAD